MTALGARVTRHRLHCRTYMRGRRRIGAVGRLLARRRLPVCGHLALATGVRVHGSRRLGGGGVEAEAWLTGVVSAWKSRPTTWCCHAVMNQWNTTQRVRAGCVAEGAWCGGAGDPLGRERCHKYGGPQGRLQVREGSANGVKGAKQRRRWRGGWRRQREQAEA
jgi:hypothetical protein